MFNLIHEPIIENGELTAIILFIVFSYHTLNDDFDTPNWTKALNETPHLEHTLTTLHLEKSFM